MKINNKLQSIKSILYPLIFSFLLIFAWQTQLIHKILKTNTLILPLPSRIISIIFENSQTILDNTIQTLSVILPALTLGSILGYLLAIFATNSPKFGLTGLNIIAAISAIPSVALAAVILQWTRDVSNVLSVRSFVMKLIIVTIVSTASMTLNAYRGLTELKPFSLDLMKSYAANNMTILLKMRVPNSIPYIFISFKVSIPACVTAALVSEYFAEEIIGVGRQIRECILKAQYSTAWAYIFIACFIGIALFIILLITEHMVMKKYKV